MVSVFQSPQIKRFLYWIAERGEIRRRRASGARRPWTEDRILQNVRFCNVRRMDDKVSSCLLEHWYHPDADSHTLLIAATLARLINWTDTLESLSAEPRKHIK